MTRTAGIVLAAGASTRMGQPKALLKTRSGPPLAAHQAQLLRDAGCAAVCIVLGAQAESIAPSLAGHRTVLNALWGQGRFTSIQAGLRSMPGFDGYLILPVDTVGVRPTTLSALLAHVRTTKPAACRPSFSGRAGRILWIRADLAAALLAEPAGDLNLERRVRSATDLFETPDPAILHNVNTPADWAAARALT